MEKKYKEFVVNSLYGLIDGSPSSLLDSMIRRFRMMFNREPDDIRISSTNRYVEENLRTSWIGSITVVLNVNGDEYSLTRDWGEAYDHDHKHPNYRSNDWFYESDDSFHWKQGHEILNSLTDE